MYEGVIIWDKFRREVTTGLSGVNTVTHTHTHTHSHTHTCTHTLRHTLSPDHTASLMLLRNDIDLSLYLESSVKAASQRASQTPSDQKP